MVPSGVFTVPALASVGLTEEAAAKQGLEVDVAVNDMRDWFSARTYAETAAWVKTLVEKGTGRIVGAHGCSTEQADREDRESENVTHIYFPFGNAFGDVGI